MTRGSMARLGPVSVPSMSTASGGVTMGPSPPSRSPEPPSSPASPSEPEPDTESDTESDAELPTLDEAEQQLISRALKQFDGNRRKTAEALGISERTLYRKLKDIDEDL